MHLQIAQPSVFRRRVDVHLLRGRVAESGDARLGVFLGEIETQGTPSTPEVEDVHAVLKLGFGAVRLEHKHLCSQSTLASKGRRERTHFCLLQRLISRREQAARVLHQRTEAGLNELGRDLCELSVRRRQLLNGSDAPRSVVRWLSSVR